MTLGPGFHRLVSLVLDFRLAYTLRVSTPVVKPEKRKR